MPSASESGLYGTRWRKLRRNHLLANPLCKMCMEDGYVRAATEVDHIIKHNGDLTLFYDTGNLESICSDHHRGYKARLERSGKDTACGLDGYPMHRRAHW